MNDISSIPFLSCHKISSSRCAKKLLGQKNMSCLSVLGIFIVQGCTGSQKKNQKELLSYLINKVNKWKTVFWSTFLPGYFFPFYTSMLSSLIALLKRFVYRIYVSVQSPDSVLQLSFIKHWEILNPEDNAKILIIWHSGTKQTYIYEVVSVHKWKSLPLFLYMNQKCLCTDLVSSEASTAKNHFSFLISLIF